MTKTIWIVNYYAEGPKSVSNPRYLEFSKYFSALGYNVVIFCSERNSHKDISRNEVLHRFNKRQYGDYQFVHLRTLNYVGNGAKRIFSIFKFAWDLFVHCKEFEKPDIILHNVHTPFDYPVYWASKRLGVKYIAEGWDMWPEDFVTFGFLRENSPVMKIAYAIERHLYKKADAIIFTLEGFMDYLREKKWLKEQGGPVAADKVHYINSGVNLEGFDDNVMKCTREDIDLNDPDMYKIVYIGAIRLVNNIKTLIDAANLLMANSKYKFLIYGDGNDREMLERYVVDNNITNVVFKEKRIPLCEVAYVVSQATVNIMNYQKNFGIHGVSSGKMFQYMAAGKPICCNIKLAYSEISRNNLGIDDNLETPEQYAAAIQKLAEQPNEEYDAMCRRVRSCAEKYDYKVLAARELKVIEDLL